MPDIFVGRSNEIQLLRNAHTSIRAELLAITGRRRVGKTHMVRTAFKSQIDFEISGIKDASKVEQLQNFAYRITEYHKSPIPYQPPSSWLEAFQYLIQILKKKNKKRKRVIFLDEFPWLASNRSGFLIGFDYFWNSWASKEHILVIICGSSASWMIKNIINNKGGLHNRVTQTIHLDSFTLKETKLFLSKTGVNLNAYQIIQIYMAMGGIPHYLKEVIPGQSAAQNINRICHQANGLLANEFNNLYSALFDHPQKHIAIIRALSSKWKGLTRNEILRKTKLANGGTFTNALKDLALSGFISEYLPFGKKKKESLYRLTDEYSLYYLKFIENSRKADWQQISQSQGWKSWSGYAFENVCLRHIEQIKLALGIQKIYSETSSFYIKGDSDSKGFQIDLLIDRKDGIINICEMKFYEDEFILNSSYAKRLRNKVALFRNATKTRKTLLLTFITSFGIKENKSSIGLVDQSLDMTCLFK